MTETRHEERTDPLVPGAHRVIRMLDAAEGPFRGALVTRGDAIAVSIGAEVHSGWEGWRFAGAEHVAGPLDVIRRANGHDVLLPWCTERVGAFLGRRALAESGLTAGEVTTLVVSLLRGIGEIGTVSTHTVEGSWWLTDAGRPVFVIGQGDDPRAGAAQVVSQLLDATRDRALGRVLQGIHDGLSEAVSQPRVPSRLLDQWEGEICGIAAPRPLQRDIHPPERARDLLSAASSRGTAVQETGGAARPSPMSRREASGRHSRARGQGRAEAVRARVIARIAALGDHGAGMLSRFAPDRDGLPRNRREPKGAPAPAATRPRRRSLIVAGAAAAAVLAGGLLLPGGATGEAPSDPRSAGTAQTEEGGLTAPTETNAEEADDGTDGVGDGSATEPEVKPEARESSAHDEDPLAASVAVLETLSGCRDGGDAVCAAAVAPGTTDVLEGVGAAEDWELALVDAYGDVAVIRMSPTPESDQSPGERMLVLVRVESKWLVRDVYDVADQP